MGRARRSLRRCCGITFAPSPALWPPGRFDLPRRARFTGLVPCLTGLVSRASSSGCHWPRPVFDWPGFTCLVERFTCLVECFTCLVERLTCLVSLVFQDCLVLEDEQCMSGSKYS